MYWTRFATIKPSKACVGGSCIWQRGSWKKLYKWNRMINTRKRSAWDRNVPRKTGKWSKNASTSTAISRHASQNYGKYNKHYDCWQVYREDFKELKDEVNDLTRELKDIDRELLFRSILYPLIFWEGRLRNYQEWMNLWRLTTNFWPTGYILLWKIKCSERSNDFFSWNCWSWTRQEDYGVESSKSRLYLQLYHHKKTANN